VGFHCAIDGKHYNEKPVMVAIKRRPVEYLNDTGVSYGVEVIKEVQVQKANVEEAKGMIEIPFNSAKVVDCRSKSPRDSYRNQPNDSGPEAPIGSLDTWKEYQREQRSQNKD